MLLAENFYTLIERHYRTDVIACSLCGDGAQSRAASRAAQTEGIIIA